MIQLYKYWLDQSISILMQVGTGYTKFKIHNWKLPKVTFYKTTKWVLSYNNLIELQRGIKNLGNNSPSVQFRESVSQVLPV